MPQFGFPQHRPACSASPSRLFVTALSAFLFHCAEVDLPLDPAAPASNGAESQSQSDPDVLAIVGGSASLECAFPSTVRLQGNSLCTGTLIHPRVVTTAAHCLGGTDKAQMTVGFGERGSPSAFSVSARCVAGAKGSSGGSTGRDWAYCILPEDPRIAKQPITPPLAACEASRFLKPGAKVMAVGYGVTTANSQSPSPKRQVEIGVERVEAGIIVAGTAKVGACYGDSGGPLYMRLVDETGRDYGWRTIGSTSGPDPRVRGCRCNCGTTFVNIAQHIAAVETNEKIDVTPCTDAQGKWSPGPACTRMPTDIVALTGKFPSCVVPTTTQPIESCGANPVVTGATGTSTSGTTATSGTSGTTAITAGATGSGTTASP